MHSSIPILTKVVQSQRQNELWGTQFLMDGGKMISVSCRVGARIPRFPSYLIYHIFYMSCPSEIITFCYDLVYLPVNFKDFLS